MSELDQFNRALRLRDEGRLEEAISLFEDLQRRSPHPNDQAQLILFRAEGLTLLGRYDQARALVVQATRLEPESHWVKAGALHELARIDRAQGRVAEALKQTEELLEVYSAGADSGWVEGLEVERGLLLAELNRCGEAVPSLERAQKISPDNWQVNFALGRCIPR